MPIPTRIELSALAAREGWPGEPRRFDSGTLPVFAFGDVVLKLYAHQHEHDIERDALQRLSANVPVPKLLGSGAIDDWRYLVMSRVEGTPLEGLLEPEDHSTLRKAGALLRQFHDTNAEGLAAAIPDFEAFMEQQRRTKALRLPAPFDRTAGRFFDSVPRGRSDRRLLHTEIAPNHILATRDEHGVTLNGVIDLAEVMQGDSAYDLAVAAFFLSRGDGVALRALLDGYRFDGAGGRPLARTLLWYLLLHRFAPFHWLAQQRPAQAGDLEELAEEWIGFA